MKTVLKYLVRRRCTVHRRREVADWIGAPSLSVRLRNELIIKFAERIRFRLRIEVVAKLKAY